MSYIFNPFTEELDATVNSIDELNDVDTTSDIPIKNEVLKWNGTNWVPASYDATFTFSIASFTDNQSTLYLIGSGTWKQIEDLTFGATYNNGPPLSGDVALSINGGAYANIGSMNSPNFTAGANYSGITFPSRDQYLRFRLSASDGTDASTSTESAIYFRNYIRWGTVSGPGTYISDDINNLTGNQISNDQTRSESINCGAGSYILFAFPSSYTDLAISGMLFNSVTCPFEAKQTVSVTNGSDFTENYDVYRSTLSGLGNSTLTTSTSDSTTNWIFYGTTNKTDTFTEEDVETVPNGGSTASNTINRSFTVTAGAGSYILYCPPKRLGSVTFYIGGFEGGFQEPEAVSVTNFNGFNEDYFTYRSTNAGLGETTVVVSGL